MAVTTRLGPSVNYFAAFGVVSCGYLALRITGKILTSVFRLLRRSVVRVDLKKYGTWAVITGCTEGIGRSYALQLAEKGLDVVLISRNPQKLTSLADDIKSRYNVRVKTIIADFKKTDVYDDIQQQLQDLDIGILVNNVGISHEQAPQYLHKMENMLQYCMDSVNVNVMSCVMMTGIVLTHLLKKRNGLIINLGSVVGRSTVPFYGVYPATKAFMGMFSRTLQLEYGCHGITVQLVMPYFIQSSLTSRLADRADLTPGLFFPTSDSFVASALRTVGKENITMGYWPHELQDLIYGRVPEWICRRIVADQVNK